MHRGQKSYTPTAFGKLWTTPGVRCIIHTSLYNHDPGMRPGLELNRGLADECYTTDCSNYHYYYSLNNVLLEELSCKGDGQI